MIEKGLARRRSLRERLELAPTALRRRVDPRSLRFRSTEEVEPLVGTIGQPRALDAIEFGLEVRTFGYNLFVSGQPGSGRESTVRDYLKRFSAERPRADDWVYVHSFEQPDRPRAIRLPAAAGREFARDMEAFVQAAKREIPRAFESEQYERRQREIRSDVGRQREQLVGSLRAFAAERRFALEITPAGVVTAPLHDGKPLSAEDFSRLDPVEQRRITTASSEIEGETATFLRRMHQLEKETEEQIHHLEREVALFATGRLFHELREKYEGHPAVLAYLGEVQDDLPEHVDDFREHEESGLAALLGPRRTNSLSRYAVNVLVDNDGQAGSPVVLETSPTYYNLLGRVEYRPAFGSMVTDFREVKAGALHRANGGFLVLDALELLQRPFAWQALKRALRDRQVRIENLAEEYSPLPTATLSPEPIPLDVKVVLIGAPALYGLLLALDQDFRELFRVKAEFAPDMDWSRQHFSSYAAFVSRWVRESGLRHFDPAAVGRLIEHGARLREDRRKLSTRFLDISDVVSEASFWAGKAGHDLVRVEDVDRAIEKREYRSSLIEERIRELVAQGTIVIDTDGAKVGQVNGISVLDLGDHSFGVPARVSARVAAGKGNVRSIEREIELSGPIHSKGFLILSGYLAGQYAQEGPLALAATITFEQSYSGVEGDSASSTELYALLSALSGLPLDQGIAVTGSVDQHGEVQAVGGVTRKVEGFFATCKALGLTGRQGVIIPATNVANLMLADEVVQAVQAGQFHVWAVRTIDEGIELLTGRRAGKRRVDGTFPPDSVHGLAAARLSGYAELIRAYGVEASGNGRAPEI
jgi:lon-related putative ATP-dependent protease